LLALPADLLVAEILASLRFPSLMALRRTCKLYEKLVTMSYFERRFTGHLTKSDFLADCVFEGFMPTLYKEVLKGDSDTSSFSDKDAMKIAGAALESGDRERFVEVLNFFDRPWSFIARFELVSAICKHCSVESMLWIKAHLRSKILADDIIEGPGMLVVAFKSKNKEIAAWATTTFLTPSTAAAIGDLRLYKMELARYRLRPSADGVRANLGGNANIEFLKYCVDKGENLTQLSEFVIEVVQEPTPNFREVLKLFRGYGVKDEDIFTLSKAVSSIIWLRNEDHSFDCVEYLIEGCKKFATKSEIDDVLSSSRMTYARERALTFRNSKRSVPLLDKMHELLPFEQDSPHHIATCLRFHSLPTMDWYFEHCVATRIELKSILQCNAGHTWGSERVRRLELEHLITKWGDKITVDPAVLHPLNIEQFTYSAMCYLVELGMKFRSKDVLFLMNRGRFDSVRFIVEMGALARTHRSGQLFAYLLPTLRERAIEMAEIFAANGIPLTNRHLFFNRDVFKSHSTLIKNSLIFCNSHRCSFR